MTLPPEERERKRRQKDAEVLLSGASLLATLRASDVPAIANDSSGQLVFWNGAAEALFRRTAASVLGKPCYDVVAGRDAFGNRYCSEDCPVLDMARRREPVLGFALRTRTPEMPREEDLGVTVLKLAGGRPDHFLLVHLLQPGLSVRPSVPLPAERREPSDDRQGGGGSPGADGARESRALTPRETEVLGWVSAGLQNKEIAQELHISLATVRNHVHNIIDKMKVHSKLEAVSVAFRRGWVTSSNLPTARGSASALARTPPGLRLGSRVPARVIAG